MYEKNNGWISVEDKIPDDNENILTYGIKLENIFDDGFPIQTAIFKNGRFLSDHFCESSYIDNVMHWMPLPEPPKL